MKCLLLGREERRGAGEGRSSLRGVSLWLGLACQIFVLLPWGLKSSRQHMLKLTCFYPTRLPKVRLANTNAACGYSWYQLKYVLCVLALLHFAVLGVFFFLGWYILGCSMFVGLYVCCIHFLS